LRATVIKISSFIILLKKNKESAYRIFLYHGACPSPVLCYCMRATSQLFRCRFVLATPLSVVSMESNGPTDDRENGSFLLKRRPVLGGGVAELPASDDDAGAAAVLVTPVQFPRRLLIFLRPTLRLLSLSLCRCTGGSVSPPLASPT